MRVQGPACPETECCAASRMPGTSHPPCTPPLPPGGRPCQGRRAHRAPGAVHLAARRARRPVQGGDVRVEALRLPGDLDHRRVEAGGGRRLRRGGRGGVRMPACTLPAETAAPAPLYTGYAQRTACQCRARPTCRWTRRCRMPSASTTTSEEDGGRVVKARPRGFQGPGTIASRRACTRMCGPGPRHALPHPAGRAAAPRPRQGLSKRAVQGQARGRARRPLLRLVPAGQL